MLGNNNSAHAEKASSKNKKKKSKKNDDSLNAALAGLNLTYNGKKKKKNK